MRKPPKLPIHFINSIHFIDCVSQTAETSPSLPIHRPSSKSGSPIKIREHDADFFEKSAEIVHKNQRLP
jgi:hypothetical protein